MADRITHVTPAHCTHCLFRDSCVPLGLSLKEIALFEDLVIKTQKVQRRKRLVSAGEPFKNIYAIRYGVFKGAVIGNDGHEQVTHFYMSGEILGLDGIANGIHACDLVALEDAEVCVIPYDRVLQLCQRLPEYNQHLQKLLSREIVRQHGVMLLLGSLHSESRIAAFLLNHAQRLEALGFSGSEFLLRMTRADIGSYLGLKLETISRAFTRFTQENIISVDQKHIQILDPEGLRAIVAGTSQRK